MRRRRRGPAQPGLPLDPDLDPDFDADFAATSSSRRRALPLYALAAVFAGGICGGLARYGITQLWPTRTSAFPWPTFGVNTAGALALGFLLAVLATAPSPRHFLRPLLGTGFLGAFTTFSSVVVTTDLLGAHGHPVTAATYLLGSLAAGLLATLTGLMLGRAITGRR
jgi:CrcB protein